MRWNGWLWLIFIVMVYGLGACKWRGSDRPVVTRKPRVDGKGYIESVYEHQQLVRRTKYDHWDRKHGYEWLYEQEKLSEHKYFLGGTQVFEHFKYDPANEKLIRVDYRNLKGELIYSKSYNQPGEVQRIEGNPLHFTLSEDTIDQGGSFKTWIRMPLFPFHKVELKAFLMSREDTASSYLPIAGEHAFEQDWVLWEPGEYRVGARLSLLDSASGRREEYWYDQPMVVRDNGWGRKAKRISIQAFYMDSTEMYSTEYR